MFFIYFFYFNIGILADIKTQHLFMFIWWFKCTFSTKLTYNCSLIFQIQFTIQNTNIFSFVNLAFLIMLTGGSFIISINQSIKIRLFFINYLILFLYICILKVIKHCMQSIINIFIRRLFFWMFLIEIFCNILFFLCILLKINMTLPIFIFLGWNHLIYHAEPLFVK